MIWEHAGAEIKLEKKKKKTCLLEGIRVMLVICS